MSATQLGAKAPQRVLVTGGTGFTGSNLVRELVGGGHAVRVLARSAARARNGLPPEVEIVEGDIADPQAIRKAVAGREIIYHLAAAYREAGIPNRRYYEVHVTGTRLLLEAARAECVRRLVHCSTVGVLGHITEPPANETTPYNPGDIYQETKAEGERLALDFQRAHGFPLTVARPTAIYGPGDLRLLKLFRMIARRRFVMLGPGDVFYHMVHVSDLTQGLRLLADHPDAVGEVFILGGEGYRTLNDLASAIASVVGVAAPKLHLPVKPFQLMGDICERVCIPLGVEPPVHRRRVDFFTKSRAFSIEKAKRIVGFQPRIPLQNGLETTAEWYRSVGMLPA